VIYHDSFWYPTKAKSMMQEVLASDWGRLFQNWEKVQPDERGYPHVGDEPATLHKSGWSAFAESLKILGTCMKEAPEFAARRRHWPTGGITNSGGFQNLPGFGYLLAPAWAVSPDVYTLVWYVAGLNLAAFALAGYALRRWFGTAATWWGLAFFAAAPWAIQYTRWIWAQDVIFPLALLVYIAVYAWIVRRQRWALLAVLLGLTALVQVHLVGIVLAVAVGLTALVFRPSISWAPLGIGVGLALASVVGYLSAHEWSSAGGERLGYEHFWRILPAAWMSVTGSFWSLEFKGGYHALRSHLGLRHWVYSAAFVVPPLLAAAGVLGVLRGLRSRLAVPAWRQDPMLVLAALTVLVPVSFMLLGIRTSPTYLTVWYPLPFVMIGVALARWRTARRWPVALPLCVVLVLQLGFFADQLWFIRDREGIPGSIVGPHVGQQRAAVATLADAVPPAREVWARYGGDSPILAESTAWLMRQQQWPAAAEGRVLLVFAPWKEPPGTVRVLAPGESPPADAALVYPWSGRELRDGRVPLRPAAAP
jgi:hypothetical protein